MSDEPEERLLYRAVDSIATGATLEAALQSLVEVLREPLELWQAAVWIVRPDADVAQILASWDMVDSVFEAGSEVSTSFTPATREGVEALRRGELLMYTVDEKGGSLVEHALREQGVASGVSVPVNTDAAGTLVLTLGSSAVGPFEAVGTSFFRGLAAGIAERVVELVRSGSS